MSQHAAADHKLQALLKGKRSVQFTRPSFPEAMRRALADDIAGILESGQLINGPFSADLERRIAEYLDRDHAICVSTCTTALQICLQFLNLQGAEVLVPAAGFTTDVSVVKWAGGKPVLVDMDPRTLSFDLADLRRKRSSRTRAIIWVHLAGLMSLEWRDIVAFALQNNLYLIEDCAHAIGASIDGVRAGASGNAACFSFYPTKMVTSGTGGAIATDDAGLDRYAREIRFFGRENGTGRVVREGNDWLLDEIRAAIACRQFDHLPGMLERRRVLAARYDRAFHGMNDVELVMRGKGEPSYYHYTIMMPSKGKGATLSAFLSERFGIPTRPIYPALQEEMTFRDLDDGTLGGAADGLARSVCLPMHSGLSDDDIDWIAGCVSAGIASLR